MTESTHKYALLITKEHPKLASPIQLDGDVKLQVGTFEDLLEEDLGEWKQWIGTLAWKRFEGERAMVLAARPTRRPDVLDHEHEQLSQRCVWAWYAYQLTRLVNPRYGHCLLVKGHAARDGEQLRLRSLAGWEELFALLRPGYIAHEDYTLRADPDWPQRMAEWYGLIMGALDQSGDLPAVADLAVNSYSMAIRAGFADFRIPGFVRAAEAVLALERGQGAPIFAARAMRLVPVLASDAFLGGHGPEQLLQQIYRLRNDCVHGKDPTAELAARGQPIDLVGRYEYVAEMVANGATRWALQHHAFLRANPGRADLEAAWRNNTVPV